VGPDRCREIRLSPPISECDIHFQTASSDERHELSRHGFQEIHKHTRFQQNAVLYPATLQHIYPKSQFPRTRFPLPLPPNPFQPANPLKNRPGGCNSRLIRCYFPFRTRKFAYFTRCVDGAELVGVRLAKSKVAFDMIPAPSGYLAGGADGRPIKKKIQAEKKPRSEHGVDFSVNGRKTRVSLNCFGSDGRSSALSPRMIDFETKRPESEKLLKQLTNTIPKRWKNSFRDSGIPHPPIS
jgi:hypothetical protein